MQGIIKITILTASSFGIDYLINVLVTLKLIVTFYYNSYTA